MTRLSTTVRSRRRSDGYGCTQIGEEPVFEAFAKLLEQRQQALRENPSLQEAQTRIAAAGSVVFSTKIVGYSSLNLDLGTGSLQELARVFNGDFDSFRVFLEAFVPVAFAAVFDEDFADRFEFGVTIPAATQRAFEAAFATPSARSQSVVQSAAPAAPGSSGTAARERAEWLWRLANGSLLVPVLIALLVMYYGLRALADIRTSQYESLKPILEHQLKLLEEDRLRFVRESTQTTAPQPRVPPASTSASGGPPVK